MPSTFEQCPDSVREMANDLIFSYEGHKPLIDAKVRLDFIFAIPELDKHGEPLGPAIKYQGLEALALAKKVGLKDRVMGRGDGEIIIDKFWWEAANEAERRAVLDHELYHFMVKYCAEGIDYDDIGRPKLQIRRHDWDLGWFNNIAMRHGAASQEVKQARQLWDDAGQAFWPAMVNDEDKQPTRA